MYDYPPYIMTALLSMEMREDEAPAYLAAFTASWGSYEPPGLWGAFHAGTAFDRLFAVYALGATGAAEARTALLPLLESARPLERWASALALGELRDERALPVLWRMLTEMLPPVTDAHALRFLDHEYPAADYFVLWRFGVPPLLGAWGRAESVPWLRAGLQAMVAVELALAPADEGELWGLTACTAFEDHVVYALGRLGGFGALAGIEGMDAPRRRWPEGDSQGSRTLVDRRPPQTHLDVWRIHLVMGALHGRYTLALGKVWRWQQTPALYEEATRLLERVFELSADVYAPALDRYAIEMGSTLSS